MDSRSVWLAVVTGLVLVGLAAIMIGERNSSREATVAAVPAVDPVKNDLRVDAGGAIYWNDVHVDDETLRALLRQARMLPRSPELNLLPDPNAPYEAVDHVLTITKEEHVDRMGFVGNEAYIEDF